MSSEPADIIREATFAACREKRDAILEVHHRYHGGWITGEALDIADKQMAGKVLLEIIETRAAPTQRR